MTFRSCGGSGGPVMSDGPEIIGFVCICSVVSVYGPENGDIGSVLMV